MQSEHNTVKTTESLDAVFYAHGRQDGSFVHIYPSEFQVTMCGYEKEPIPVVIAQCDTGEYWGFDTGKAVRLIQSSLVALEICFPYGLEAAEARGEGKRARLNVTKLT